LTVKKRIRDVEERSRANKKWYRGTRAKAYRKNPKKYLWDVAKKRAQRFGVEFTITPEDIVVHSVCPITQQPVAIFTNKISTSMSLDRVDNSKGYVPGNVHAISRRANLRKSDLTKQEVRNLLQYMELYS